MSINLTYWGDIQGRAVTLRYMIRHSNQKLNFTAQDRKTWPAEKIELEKSENPLINLPYIDYEYEPGKFFKLSQTYLLIKVLGEKLGYHGKSVMEKLMVAQVEEQIREIDFGLALNVFFEKEKAKMEMALKARTPNILSGLEKVLNFHNQKYLCCDHLTYPDFMLFVVTENLLKMRPTILDNFPKLLAWKELMKNDPKIAESMEIEGNMPFFFNYKKMFEDFGPEMREHMIKKVGGEENYKKMLEEIPEQVWGVEGKMGKICD